MDTNTSLEIFKYHRSDDNHLVNKSHHGSNKEIFSLDVFLFQKAPLQELRFNHLSLAISHSHNGKTMFS